MAITTIPDQFDIDDGHRSSTRSTSSHGAAFKRQGASVLKARAAQRRLMQVPLLSRDEELDAIEKYKAKHGVVRCPTAFVLPSQMSSK